jgi:hypothetical protein
MLPGCLVERARDGWVGHAVSAAGDFLGRDNDIVRARRLELDRGGDTPQRASSPPQGRSRGQHERKCRHARDRRRP